MTGFSVILLPTDRGEPALDALGLASTLVRRDGRLIVARIEPPEGGPRTCPCSRRGDAGSSPAPEDEPAGRPRIEHLVRTGPGPVADTIVALAEELGCELIVIGSHEDEDRDGAAGLGRVAQEVLRRAACPVLCLPAHAHAACLPEPHPGGG